MNNWTGSFDKNTTSNERCSAVFSMFTCSSSNLIDIYQMKCVFNWNGNLLLMQYIMYNSKFHAWLNQLSYNLTSIVFYIYGCTSLRMQIYRYTNATIRRIKSKLMGLQSSTQRNLNTLNRNDPTKPYRISFFIISKFKYINYMQCQCSWSKWIKSFNIQCLLYTHAFPPVSTWKSLRFSWNFIQ